MNTTHYGIMVLSVFVAWLEKVSIHGTAEYDYLRKNHSKSYIRKNKGHFWSFYFLLNFKNELPKFLFFCNFILGIWLFVSAAASIIYGVLWICGHQLTITLIPDIFCAIDICIIVFRYSRVLLQYFKLI